MIADISFQETYCITNNKKCEKTELKKPQKRKAKWNAFPVSYSIAKNEIAAL